MIIRYSIKKFKWILLKTDKKIATQTYALGSYFKEEWVNQKIFSLCRKSFLLLGCVLLIVRR